MKPIGLTIILIAISILGIQNIAESASSHVSKYAGQENRNIKSLSHDDIDQLRNGKGWGLAKAAELNGMPGPAHLLEMKEEIQLSEDQKKQVEKLFAEMNEQAIPLGLRLIKLESRLNKSFENRSINKDKLKSLLNAISEIHAELRYVHLSAHLKTPHILTDEQIAQYNSLRGYSSGDPCSKVPAGHNAEMWKKHNNCE